MQELERELKDWLWFFTGAAVVVSAGLAKILLSDHLNDKK